MGKSLVKIFASFSSIVRQITMISDVCKTYTARNVARENMCQMCI